MSNTNATLAKTATITEGLREDNKRQAASLLVKAPLAMLAMGAMLRGATGLRDMFATPGAPSPTLLGASQVVPLPRLYRPGEAEEKDKTPPRAGKFAAEGAAKGGFNFASIPQYISDKLIYPFIETKPGETPAGWKGDGANNAMGVPIAGAALPLAALGGFAGFKGMDAMLDSRRQAQKKDELDKVKAQYLDALRGKYASDEDLNADFDKTAEAMLEKTADPIGSAPAPEVGLDSYLPDSVFGRNATSHLGGEYAGGTLAAMLTSALAGGYLGFNHFNKNSRRKLMEEALRRRAAAQNDPSQPIYADVE